MAHSGAAQHLLNWTELNRHTGPFGRLPYHWPGSKCQPGGSWGPQPGSKYSPRGTSLGGDREDEGLGRRLLVVVGGRPVPPGAAAGPGPAPPAPLFLPPGPFSLSETQTPELSTLPTPPPPPLPSSSHLPRGGGLRGRALIPEDRGPGRGSRRPWFKPRKTNTPHHPTFSGLLHQIPGLSLRQRKARRTPLPQGGLRL